MIATRLLSRTSKAIPASRRQLASSSLSWSHQQPAFWSDEWKRIFPPHLFFVQMGFGVDQHGQMDATKAATRAVRNAIEFNSIPAVISHLPGGRSQMLIHVKLGVPAATNTSATRGDPNEDEQAQSGTLLLMPVDVLQVAKVFPYGKLLPIQITCGGLSFHTGRIVEELGDSDDVGICVAACVSLGYADAHDNKIGNDPHTTTHRTYNTRDGY